jgi:hypothetical protein
MVDVLIDAKGGVIVRHAVCRCVRTHNQEETMPEKSLDALVRRTMPSFVTRPAELHVLRRLHGAGYVEARFFPEEHTVDQFAELRGVTPLGRRVLGIVTRYGAHGG